MTRMRTTLVYSMLVMVLVLAALDQTILGTALPVIGCEFHGQSRLSWVFSAYLITSTVVIPLYGKAADLYGRKPMLLVAVFFFLLGSLGCGFSASMPQLILARVVQGAGGGGLMTLALLAVVDLFPEQGRGKYQGILGAFYGISTMFGPLIGGLLVEKLSWQWAFFMNVPGALVALAVIGICYRRVPVQRTQTIDVPGAALLAAVLFTVLLATGNEPDLASLLPGTGVMVTLVAVLTGLFITVELRARHPILPLTLFASRVFSAAIGISAVSGVALFAAVVFLPIYLQSVLLKTPLTSAWHLFPLMFGITLSAIVAGKTFRSGGPIRASALGAVLLMVFSYSAVALVFRFSADDAFALSSCLFPLGLSIGVLFPLITIVSQRVAPKEHMGIGTAMPIMVRALGGAIGVAVLGSILNRDIARQLGTESSSVIVQSSAEKLLDVSQAVYASAFAGAAQTVFWSVAALSLLAGVAALALPTRLSGAKPF